MKTNKTLILFATAALLASCGGSTEQYDVTWVSPTGIPTLAFYDQGENTNWQSFADATQVAKGFATDNVDAIVFDGYSGLKNIKENNRNYVLARWISGGTFYLVSTKHASIDEYEATQTVEAFVKTGNAAQAFLNLAKTHWNWGDLSAEGSLVNWETGVAAVKNTLENNDKAYDWYLVAQPVLFAVKNTLAQKEITLNVVANLQTEWANAHNGAKIPAAALFVNKTRYADHKQAIDKYIDETDARIVNAIDNPSVAVTALSDYAQKHDDIATRFGYQPQIVNALQKDGANTFNLIKKSEVGDIAEIANAFARDLGQTITFEDSLFLK